MKARMPEEYTHTSRRAKEKEQQRERERVMAVFFLHTAVTLHLFFGFGKKRINKFLNGNGGVIDGFGGLYDDASVWKCVQILEDLGIDMEPWKKILRGGRYAG